MLNKLIHNSVLMLLEYGELKIRIYEQNCSFTFVFVKVISCGSFRSIFCHKAESLWIQFCFIAFNLYYFFKCRTCFPQFVWLSFLCYFLLSSRVDKWESNYAYSHYLMKTLCLCCALEEPFLQMFYCSYNGNITFYTKLQTTIQIYKPILLLLVDFF